MRTITALGRVVALVAFTAVGSQAHARPADYGKLRGEFALMCDLLKDDGRIVLVATLLEPQVSKDASCPDCRPLFMQFFGACRPTIAAKDRPSTRRPKKQPTAQEPALEPTTGEAGVAEQAVVAEQAGLAEDTALTQDEDAAPIPEVREPQRFPQLALLDVASQISRELAEDERNPAQTRQAVERLRAALTPAALKPGERDYLQTLTSFLAGAFESMSTPLAASQKRPTTKGLFSEEDTEVSKHAKDDTRGKHPKSQTATAEDEETIDQSSDGFR